MSRENCYEEHASLTVCSYDIPNEMLYIIILDLMQNQASISKFASLYSLT
jgi:hypothetical protein